jgi:alkylhydroperoxidase family enzyme
MATTPRIPEDLLATMRNDRAIPPTFDPELQRLAGHPIRANDGLQLDRVITELIRLMGARSNGCTFCNSVRNVVALQSGADEEMFDKIDDFETSDLPERLKAALRITRAVLDYPKGITDELWAASLEHFSEEELADIVFFSAFATGSRIPVTLGFDPGPRDDRLLFPTDAMYAAQGMAEELDELRRLGFVVDADRVEDASALT